jgi:hypothetical protein
MYSYFYLLHKTYKKVNECVQGLGGSVAEYIYPPLFVPLSYMFSADPTFFTKTCYYPEPFDMVSNVY